MLQGLGTHAKGGRERDIPIDDKACEFVRQMREQGMRRQDRHVFVHRKTLGRAYDNVRRVANKRLGIESRGTHGFRKLFAAELYKHHRCAINCAQRLAEVESLATTGHPSTAYFGFSGTSTKCRRTA